MHIYAELTYKPCGTREKGKLNLFESAKTVPIDRVIDVMHGLSGARRQSGRLVMSCPFHQDPTPSFTIYEKTNSFYCFGCGAGGDGIKFVQKFYNLPPRDAAMAICRAFGLMVDVDSNKPETQAVRQQIESQQERRKLERALLAWADAAYLKLCALRRAYFTALNGFEELQSEWCMRLDYIDYVLDLLQFGSLADKLAVYRAVRQEELGLVGGWLRD